MKGNDFAEWIIFAILLLALTWVAVSFLSGMGLYGFALAIAAALLLAKLVAPVFSSEA